MRWIAISLVLINAVVIIWYQLNGTQEPSAQVAQGLPELTYNNLHAGGRPVPENPPSLSALSQNGKEQEEQCAFIGSFASRDIAESAQQRLSSLEIAVRIEVVEIPDEPLWWVHVPPAGTASEAQRMLAGLNERQIESFLVTQGEFANAISLGYFRSRSNAVTLNERYNADGIDSSVREIQRFNDRFWLIADPGDGGLVSESTVRTLRASTPDIELQREHCDWLQNS